MRLIRTNQRLYMQTRTQTNNFIKAQKECKKAVRGGKRKFQQLIAKNENKRPFTSYITRTKKTNRSWTSKSDNKMISDYKHMA